MILLKQRLIKIHVYLIIFVLINFIVIQFCGIGLHSSLVFITKIIIYLTGLTLFFIMVRPFKKLSIYFSLYLLTPVLIFISWLTDGILGAILASIFFYGFFPPNAKFKDGDFTFYEKFTGFLGSCCTYNIIETKYVIFQKNVGEIILTENHSFENSTFKVSNKTGYLKLNMEVYDRIDTTFKKVDTTLIITLQ